MSEGREAAIEAAIRAECDAQARARNPEARLCGRPACTCTALPHAVRAGWGACEARTRAMPPTPQPTGMTAVQRAALLEVLDYLARPEPASQSERDAMTAFAAAIRKETSDAT